MKILFAASECVPFIKVGGLADVVGTLPKFLKSNQNNIRVVLPKYQKIDEQKFSLKSLSYKLNIPVSNKIETANIFESNLNNNIPVYFIQNNKYFDRPEVYGTSKGDYPDNRERFIFFSRAVTELMKALNFKADIIHCHDWQTALIPAYIKINYKNDLFYNKMSSLYTIHNIAYQGSFYKDTLETAGFSWKDFTWDKLEYFDQFNFMKIGIVYADKISTVSPTYAKEILNIDKGRGMENILKVRKNDIVGILNGIDYDEWNPARDPFLIENFSAGNFENKKLCKQDLQQGCGLPVKPDSFLLGSVSRLDYQKGFDLIEKAIPEIIKKDIQLVLLGDGDQNINKKLTSISEKFPNKVKFIEGFNNPLAHKIYAGSDAFLMPSHFEPCGLGQMIALAYGTIPIVHKTGGLADTIKDFNQKTEKGNGFSFTNPSSKELASTVCKAFEHYQNIDNWLILVNNAFKTNFSWERTVKEYTKLYDKIIEAGFPARRK